MTAPASYDRVRAMLERLSPGFPSTDETTDAGKKLSAIATLLGIATDVVDNYFEEMFPDGTTQNIDRWSLVASVNNGSDLTIDQKRNQVLSVLRRTTSPRLPSIAAVLAPLFDLAPSAITFKESTRAEVEAATVYDSGTIAVPLAAAATTEFWIYPPKFPGTIDNGGIRLTVTTTGGSFSTVVLSHNGITSSTFTHISSVNDYPDRTTFLGRLANVGWKLTFGAATGVTVTRVKLMVSNTVDSRSRFFFYAFRDPALSGTANLAEAKRIFRSTALAHDKTIVAERDGFIVGDPHSLVGREPVGAP